MDTLQVAKTGEDLIKALEAFAQTSNAVVGLDNTIKGVERLTELMQKSPGIFQKLVQPETMEKITSIASSKKKMGPVEMISVLGEFKEIFAS